MFEDVKWGISYNPSDYCEVLHYHVDSGWQVSEAYDGFYC